jgi:hypothetical protein
MGCKWPSVRVGGGFDPHSFYPKISVSQTFCIQLIRGRLYIHSFISSRSINSLSEGINLNPYTLKWS